MIIDASVVIDAVTDPGPRGAAARSALSRQPAAEPLTAPGHFTVEVLSGLRAAAGRPTHPLQLSDVASALRDAEALGIRVHGTPWADVHRAWALAQGAMRHTDAVYVAAAERLETDLLTADARLGRTGAQLSCRVIVVAPDPGPS